jgi:hypothetical protein
MLAAVRPSSHLLALAVAGLLLLVALPAAGARGAAVIDIPAAPALATTTVHPGDELTATTRYRNAGTTAGVLRTAVQTVRRPGQPHDHPTLWDGNFTNTLSQQLLGAGADVLQTGTLQLSSSAPLGQWEVYAAWQDAGGRWHDGPSGAFTVVDPSTPLPAPPAPAPPATTPPAPGDPAPAAPATPPPASSPTTAPAEPTVDAQGSATVVTAPVPASAGRTFTAADALREARAALRLTFKTAYLRRTRFTATCVRNSATKRTCQVSWRSRGVRYRGRVVVELTATAYTTIVYVKRTRR